MRTRYERIHDPFGGSLVHEIVAFDDFAAAFDASLIRLGVDPAHPALDDVRTRLFQKAHVVRCSTWGHVYRADHARHDLRETLASLGVSEARMPSLDAEPVAGRQ
ncbi:hypothetical protein [Methylobacterium sp. WL6]|uniref:hypothetical protein n=1 Tax=Methylobacterium sp. WL6 TaxID=2603901 RepID=UPI0011CC8FFB|nr:hypothetical protein [Methylobacterium sp. WL6]TXN70486.1 hypothetical protein FV230_10565 [Methylobacterium sp. WL6]